MTTSSFQSEPNPFNYNLILNLCCPIWRYFIFLHCHARECIFVERRWLFGIRWIVCDVALVLCASSLVQKSLFGWHRSCCFIYCMWTSSWSSGKCVRFGAGRSRVRLSAGSYHDLINWYCSILTSYLPHGVRKSCRELTQNNNKNQQVKLNLKL